MKHVSPAHPTERPSGLLAVRHLMTRDPICLSEDDNLKALEQLLSGMGIRHVPITDSSGKLIGLVTQRDFLTVSVSKLAHADPKDLSEIYASIPLREIMGRKVTTVDPDLPLSRAAEIMLKSKFGCLPVTDSDGTLLGIITEADFVRAFLEFDARFAR